MLKRLKCNNVLNDYSDYKFNKVIIMMKAVLVDYKELTGDYSWIVDCGYSQKWSKCRGVRFNNTIYVKSIVIHLCMIIIVVNIMTYQRGLTL